MLGRQITVNMDLSIIIVNYKSKSKLVNCLTSIFRARSAGFNKEVIVVDNASGDDLSDLSERFSSVKFIFSPRNLGMGGGNNLGIKNSTGKFILILNPDTIILDEAIAVLFDYLKGHPAVGMIGPKLVYPDRSLQFSCSRFPQFFTPILRRTFLGDYFKASRDRFTMNDFDHNSLKEVDWLMGSCLLFRSKTVNAAGETFVPRFDERYFMYFEDTDLGRQMRAAGLKAIYNPEATVIHDHARESAKYPWYWALLRDKLAWRHIASWLKYFLKWGLKVENRE